jgi:hypothetical protein
MVQYHVQQLSYHISIQSLVERFSRRLARYYLESGGGRHITPTCWLGAILSSEGEDDRRSRKRTTSSASADKGSGFWWLSLFEVVYTVANPDPKDEGILYRLINRIFSFDSYRTVCIGHC